MFDMLEVIFYKQHSMATEVGFLEMPRCVSLVSEHPNQFAIVRDDIRRVVTKRFPYCIYFPVEQHRIVVLAVFHGNRNPAIWQART